MLEKLAFFRGTFVYIYIYYFFFFKLSRIFLRLSAIFTSHLQLNRTTYVFIFVARSNGRTEHFRKKHLSRSFARLGAKCLLTSVKSNR